MPDGVFHPSQRRATQAVQAATEASLQRYAAAPSKAAQPAGSMTADQISAMLDAASSRVLALQTHVPPPSGTASCGSSASTSASTSPRSGFAGQLSHRQSAAAAVAAAPAAPHSSALRTSSDSALAAARSVTFKTAQHERTPVPARAADDGTSSLKERLAALHGHLQSL